STDRQPHTGAASDGDWTSGAGVRRHEREHIRVSCAITLGKRDPTDEKRRGERIRPCRVRRDDAHTENAASGPARAGIDDMTVAAAVLHEELHTGAARADGRIAERQYCERASGDLRRHE